MKALNTKKVLNKVYKVVVPAITFIAIIGAHSYMIGKATSQGPNEMAKSEFTKATVVSSIKKY